MTIKISYVSFCAEGAEVLVGVLISNGEHAEKKRLLLPSEKYIEHGLCKGRELSRELFEELFSLSQDYRAIKKGGELLSYSSKSKAALTYKLKMKGFDSESAERAVEYLSERNAINEEESIEKLIDSGMKKLWGKKRIYAELVKKGYERALVSAALRMTDDGEFLENCKHFIKKKCGSVPSDPVERKRLVAALLRRGYSYSEIQAVIGGLED